MAGHGEGYHDSRVAPHLDTSCPSPSSPSVADSSLRQRHCLPSLPLLVPIAASPNYKSAATSFPPSRRAPPPPLLVRAPTDLLSELRCLPPSSREILPPSPALMTAATL
ncbi:hypothetical protein E2562_020637 [Oryza meyeriana var. granulata]|uniref:Uncharacterized protein n=1 Tax=Oryza meyeriana var. granulata TaxID=110450 RepID=A0A6G1EAZ2_9ORYZ|nr:hypothetical protein E2562_020637 [Oryza meyeriana var. granulata]